MNNATGYRQQGAFGRRSIVRLLFVFGCLMLVDCVCIISGHATAQDTTNQQIDPADQRLLEKGTTKNWYSDDGTLVFPSSISRDYLESRSRIVLPPKVPSRSNWNWFNGTFFPFIQTYWIAIFVTAILLIGALAIFFIFRNSSYFTGRSRTSDVEDRELTAAKISDLPFQLELPVRGLLEEADAYRKNRDYSRAIIYLFSYVLVELDRNRRIRLQRGKTNRMYLREIKSDMQLRAFVERVMLAFEWVFFGRHELSEQNFNACWDSLDEFRNRLAANNEPEAMFPAPPAPALPSSGGLA
jgi:hypothetical protein